MLETRQSCDQQVRMALCKTIYRFVQLTLGRAHTGNEARRRYSLSRLRTEAGLASARKLAGERIRSLGLGSTS